MRHVELLRAQRRSRRAQPRRVDQARGPGRGTRRSILDAAHELFVATGYAATTIQTIAQRAGVAVQTVYAVFGNKRELLRQLIETTTITGDDESPAITERVAPIVRVTEEAPASDPELATMVGTVKATRRKR